LEKGIVLSELYICPEWYPGDQGNEPGLIADAQAAGARVFRLSKDAFAKVAYRERPDGLLAVAPQWRRTFADLETLLKTKSGGGGSERGDSAGMARAPFL